MNIYDEEKIIIEVTNYFLKKIGNNEVHILKDVSLPKIDERTRDFLEGTLNALVKAQDTLEEKILCRTVGDLEKTVKDTIDNLKIIIDEVKLHDSHIVNVDKEIRLSPDISDEDRRLLQQSGKKIQSNSRILLNAPKNFKFTKRDIIKLTYYELMELYKQAGYNHFKAKAIDTIHRKFDINLTGDKLEISLIKISSEDQTKQLSIPTDFPQHKLHYPTFSTTI